MLEPWGPCSGGATGFAAAASVGLHQLKMSWQCVVLGAIGLELLGLAIGDGVGAVNTFVTHVRILS